jgi:hypothetical protein
MELIPKDARERMLANGWRNAELIVKDQEPEDFRSACKSPNRDGRAIHR